MESKPDDPQTNKMDPGLEQERGRAKNRENLRFKIPKILEIFQNLRMIHKRDVIQTEAKAKFQQKFVDLSGNEIRPQVVRLHTCISPATWENYSMKSASTSSSEDSFYSESERDSSLEQAYNTDDINSFSADDDEINEDNELQVDAQFQVDEEVQVNIEEDLGKTVFTSEEVMNFGTFLIRLFNCGWYLFPYNENNLTYDMPALPLEFFRDFSFIELVPETSRPTQTDFQDGIFHVDEQQTIDANKEMPNDEIPDDEIPDDEIPNGEVPNGDVPDDDVPDDDVPDDEIPNGEIPDDEIPEDEIQNEFLVNEFLDDEISNEFFADEFLEDENSDEYLQNEIIQTEILDRGFIYPEVLDDQEILGGNRIPHTEDLNDSIDSEFHGFSLRLKPSSLIDYSFENINRSSSPAGDSGKEISEIPEDSEKYPEVIFSSYIEGKQDDLFEQTIETLLELLKDVPHCNITGWSKPLTLWIIPEVNKMETYVNIVIYDGNMYIPMFSGFHPSATVGVQTEILQL